MEAHESGDSDREQRNADRKQRQYNQREMVAINRFKQDYYAAITPQSRKDVFEKNIFPALREYWESVGIILTSHDQVLKKARVCFTMCLFVCC